MVYPEPCKELKRRPHPFLAEIVHYYPPIARVMIVTHLGLSQHTVDGQNPFAPPEKPWFLMIPLGFSQHRGPPATKYGPGPSNYP